MTGELNPKQESYFTIRLAQTAVILVAVLLITSYGVSGKDFKKDPPQKGNLCIARFESTTGEPLYYTCPRQNESEKKSYCCYLDKCCDYKEFQKQTEQQFKISQGMNYMPKGAIGTALKIVFWTVFGIIFLIVCCCCATFFLCRKKKLFQGEIFNSPLPAQPPGPSPYAPPSNPYMAYQWPPETAPAAQGQPGVVPPPAYPNPSYPPYPSSNGQPPFNPNFK